MPSTLKRQFKGIDLCCGAGGASKGYWIAGIDIIGVDFKVFRRYPYEQILKDVLELTPEYLAQFDFVHASPPCQLYSPTSNINPDALRVDLIPPVRDLIYEARLINPDLLYVIENVKGSPLIDPLELCGATFGLTTYRHRYFELNFDIVPPPHIPHVRLQAQMGRRPMPYEFMDITGVTADVKQARVAMGIDWMSGEELSQAIPPAYSAYIGAFARRQLDRIFAGKPLFSRKVAISP